MASSRPKGQAARLTRREDQPGGSSSPIIQKGMQHSKIKTGIERVRQAEEGGVQKDQNIFAKGGDGSGKLLSKRGETLEHLPLVRAKENKRKSHSLTEVGTRKVSTVRNLLALRLI